MKTYLQFINEEYHGFDKNAKVFSIEDLADHVSRMQAGPKEQEIMNKIKLKQYQDLLDKGGNYAVKKQFERDTDLQLKPLIRGKFQLVYDIEKSMQYK